MKIKRKPTLRETLKANNEALIGLCRMAGKELPEDMKLNMPDKRIRTPSVQSNASQLEVTVVREVTELLSKHPSVLFAIRQNSGAAKTDSAIVFFYRWVKRPGSETVTDFWGMLKDGRMFAIECKRRSWTKPTGARELQQKAFIDTVISVGGVGGFATCVEDVLSVLGNLPTKD